MAKYQLTIKKSAEKELAILPLEVIITIRDRIVGLGNNPFPSGYKNYKVSKIYTVFVLEGTA